MSELEQDYGVTLCLSIFCTPDPVASITGPSTVPVGECSWGASVSKGVPPFTYSWSGIGSGSNAVVDAYVSSSGWLYLAVTDDIGHTDNASK